MPSHTWFLQCNTYTTPEHVKTRVEQWACWSNNCIEFQSWDHGFSNRKGNRKWSSRKHPKMSILEQALTSGHSFLAIFQNYHLSRMADHYTAWFLDPKCPHLASQTSQFLSNTNFLHLIKQDLYHQLHFLYLQASLRNICKIAQLIPLPFIHSLYNKTPPPNLENKI
jgi:hypothetical protein